jgi:hypothetical protein
VRCEAGLAPAASRCVRPEGAPGPDPGRSVHGKVAPERPRDDTDAPDAPADPIAVADAAAAALLAMGGGGAPEMDRR